LTPAITGRRRQKRDPEMTHLTIIGACYIIAGLIGMVQRVRSYKRAAWRFYMDRHSMTEICLGSVYLLLDFMTTVAGVAADGTIDA
jgi:hypothetical protein